MSAAPAVLRHLRTITAAERTDRELLRAFATHRDEAAFAALVRRHGGMVLGVCRRLLGHEQDAEDAYQAAFLVLARKAGSIRAETVGGWLYGVAQHIALRIRRSAARQRRRDRLAGVRTAEGPTTEAALREVQALLDAEVARLPEKWRTPFVLCCLEGKSKTEAARELGWKEGTVSSRLAQARERLRDRLTRRGVTLSAALTALALSHDTASAALVSTTVRSGLAFASGATVNSAAAALARETLRTLTVKHAKLAVLLLMVVGLAGGIGVQAVQNAGPAAPAQTGPVAEARSDTPKEDGKERVDAFGDPLPAGAVARLGTLRLYHGKQVDRIALSPDGAWVVSMTREGNRLWDARTGKERPLREDVKGAAVLATTDKLLALIRQPGRSVLWDVMADKQVGRLPLAAGVNGPPLGLSPDGKTVVWRSGTAGEARSAYQLRFVDTAWGIMGRSIDLKGNQPVWEFVFSADGRTLAVHYLDNSVDICDVVTPKIRLSLKLQTNLLGQIALSPDGGTLAVAVHNEKRIRFWDTRTGQERESLAIKPGRSTGAVAFAPDGKFLAATYEAEVGLWDLAARKEIRRLQGKESGLSCPVFSRDGKRLAAGDGNGISVWDVATGRPCHDLGHSYAVDGLAFAPDGRTIVSGAAYTDTVLRAWDPLTGQIKARWRGHTTGIEVVAYAPDGKLIASGSQDGSVRLWDPATGKEVRRLEAHDGMIYGMAFSPDGRKIASGGQRKAVHLWDVATGREIRAFDNPGGFVLRLAFSPDGKLLATRGIDEDIVRLWDAAGGKELHRLPGPRAGCPNLSFSPDSRVLAVNGDDGTIRIWDVALGREVQALGEPLQPGQANRCLAVAYAPDGRSLAAGYDDSTVRLWEVISGRERARFQGHVGVPLSLAYSADGSLLASGGSDHTAVVWDVLGQRTTSSKRDAPGRADPNGLWADLAGADAGKAYRAVQTLLGAADRAVPLLKEHVQPVRAVDGRRITRLIADLDSDQFDVREQAARQLRDLGDRAEPVLRAALAGKLSPEVQRRVKTLLAQLDAAGSPALLGGVRAVETLEHINTPEARAVLQDLARGAAEARLTREAKAALERQARRPTVSRD
jgi:RNA polymerase sigma factor (sigma-70 family)